MTKDKGFNIIKYTKVIATETINIATFMNNNNKYCNFSTSEENKISGIIFFVERRTL